MAKVTIVIEDVSEDGLQTKIAGFGDLSWLTDSNSLEEPDRLGYDRA